MTAEALLEAVFLLNPAAAERASRLAAALTLLRAGTSQHEARAQLRVRFRISRVAAWRIVDMASDLAGPLEEKKP